MSSMSMYLIIALTLFVTLSIYVTWGQTDDFCFVVILALLLFVLYIVQHPNKHSIERFAEESTSSQTPQSQQLLDIKAFQKLIRLKQDVGKVLQPKFKNVVAAFKGTAAVPFAQKYDSDGNAVQQEFPDEIPVAGNAQEVRTANRVLHDLKSYDPNYYAALLALSSGLKEDVIEEEFPI